MTPQNELEEEAERFADEQIRMQIELDNEFYTHIGDLPPIHQSALKVMRQGLVRVFITGATFERQRILQLLWNNDDRWQGSPNDVADWLEKELSK